jgi:hypothetical protein
MRHDVKSATVRGRVDLRLVSKRCREAVVLSAKGYLEAILEGGTSTGTSRKSRVEMAQGVGIGKSVSFDRRIADQIEPSPEEVSSAVPFEKPAIGTR